MAETPQSLNLRHELGRKAIHLLSALTPLIYAFISRERALAILIPLFALIIVIDILRQVQPTPRTRAGADDHRRRTAARAAESPRLPIRGGQL